MTPEQQARNWLQQQGIGSAVLAKLSGYTNHVFLVEQEGNKTYPAKSVLRLADQTLEAGLCPLAEQGESAIAKYLDAERLGLAPPLILADAIAGVMWLEYAGEQVSLERSSFNSIRTLLERLHGSDFEWGGSSDTEDAEKSLLALKGRFTADQDPVLMDAIDHLLWLGGERAYFDKPKVPVHSDLNPGNWLNNGERWWLIDWDYAGMYPMEWDYAGLIVEHHWDEAWAVELLPEVALRDLAWFCSHQALLSWDWHSQRGSNLRVRNDKCGQFRYWFSKTEI